MDTNVATARVGFIGLGTMGASMAANLARASFELIVWNRTPGRDDEVLALGARRAAVPAEVAAASDVIVLCVTDSPQVDEVLFAEGGLVEGLRAGSLIIDCSSISPLTTLDFAARLSSIDVKWVDAPVSGGSEGALQGTLSIMVGGAEEDVARAQPILGAMGTTITHVGELGAGQWVKAINQVMLAGTYLGVAEGITLGLKAGLDMGKVVSALSGGAAASWILSNRSGRMIDDDYPLGFKLALHRKDLAIALALAHETGAELPVATLAAAFEDELIAQGHGDDDNSALARSIRQRSGL
ncbi:MAG: NAD(P)-dependent oxidoreductase [Acidobacteria bacterium]|nr:NAD(P)-dependent oxidoreductase [Acidobacteriota bacterium]